MPHYANYILDYGSYVFNGCDNAGNDPAKTTLLNVQLSTVKHPTRTWLMSEWPIHWSYSWHKSLTGDANISYKNAIDNVSFVDGHASYIKLYYNATLGPAPFAYPTPQIPGWLQLSEWAGLSVICCSLAAAVLLFLSCTPKETKVLLGPSEALGTVLAEETTRMAGAKKQVAIISPDAKWGAVSTAEEAFRNALKKQGFTVVTAKAANLGDPMRRGQLGLKAGDFLRPWTNRPMRARIVSFAGAPMLSAGDATRVPAWASAGAGGRHRLARQCAGYLG